MRKSRLFLVINCFILSMGFYLNGLYYPSWSQNHSKNNFLNYNSLLNSSNSSTWSRIWEVDSSIGEEIVTDLSNNVYIVGRIYYNFDNLIFNIKYDKYGYEQWNITWKFNSTCDIAGFTADTQYNIYNLVNLHYQEKSILMKIDKTGKSVWNKTIAGDAECIYLDKHDNIYISGYIWDGSRDELHIYLKKFNKNGISQCNHSFLMDDIINLFGVPCTIMVDHLNQTYMAGILFTNGFKDGDIHSFGRYHPAPLIFTCIYNSSGNLVSYNMWRILDYYISTSMIFDTSSNLYLIGADKLISRNIILKYSSSGHLLLTTPDWQKDAIVDSSEFWERITLDSYNNIYCCGTNHYFTGKPNSEFYLVKFNNEGNFEFDGAWNNLCDAWCRDIYIDSNLSIYLTGNRDKRALVLKNPVFGEFSNPPYINPYITINLIITLASIFGILGMVGVYFYIRFRKRSH